MSVEETGYPRNFLVAVDGSEPSYKAVRYAVQLAKIKKGSIIVLHVVLLPSFAAPETLETLRRELSQKGKDILAKAKNMVAEAGIPVAEGLVETNRSVVLAIIEEAQKQHVDLIVVGTKGTSGIPKLMLGSVAAGVVSFAHCSVLGVR